MPLIRSHAAASQLARFLRPRPHGHLHPKSERLLPVRTAYTALAWVIVFFTFHVYWYLGGSFGLNGELPPLAPDSVAGWIGEVLTGAAWPLGVWVCLSIARGWPRGRMRRAAAIIVWLACTALVVRGAAGLIDDLTRAIGLLPDGITGLSREQTMGAEYYRSASAIWSGNVTDAYFLAGGVLFGLLGRRYRPASARDTGRVRLAGRPATVGR
jgi:hypothetical protein